MYRDDELLALAGLQHIAYCERQWALIHLEQIWSESKDTVRGELFHDRVDLPGYINVKGVRSERGQRVVSYRLGLYGIADVVEYLEDGTIFPVEYKVGKPKVEDWDRLQLAAQALCLEEMEGIRVAAGALFYGETRRRERVEISNQLRERVEQLSEKMHRLHVLGMTPREVPSSKCRRCSLIDDCAPEALVRDVCSYWREYEPELGV
ncbi:CRISPR-associated protein Cas4 [Enorma phocaeensis]|uniref:CRISPR-associated protein Cas4 n=1 Tax=Enorma phocaeensis TaxID=1871019 RepID=UPI0032084C80